MRLLLWNTLIASLLTAFLIYFFASQNSVRLLNITTLVDAEVLMIEDKWGVAHVEAQSYKDALFALGFLHAKNRLWQMDLLRRIATGRLSEIFGEVTVETDLFYKTLGLERRAEKGFKQFNKRQRKLLESYVKGINFGVSSMTFLPLEYYITWSSWEEWTTTDSLAEHSYLSFMLATGWGKEVLRSYYGDIIGHEAANLILPFELEHLRKPTYIVSEDELPVHLKANPERPEAAVRTDISRETVDYVSSMTNGFKDEGMASNAWVISGNHTKSGKPLIANDPHLASLIPSVFYLVDIKLAQSSRLIGGTVPGLNSVQIGRNDNISWTVTAFKGDTIDLFVETRNPNNTSEYLYDGKWLPMTTFEEVIKVKGGNAVKVMVELTRHGPLLPKNRTVASTATPYFPDKPLQQDIAVRWPALEVDDDSLALFADLALSKDLSEARVGLRSIKSPALSVLLATTTGDIGYQAVGLLPLRSKLAGTPLNGSLISDDWKGFVPAEDMPYVINPAKGYIVTANNNPMPSSYKYFYALGSEYSEGRAERITELIEEQIQKGQKFTAEDMLTIQQDEIDVLCRDALPQMMALTQPSAFWEEMNKWKCDMKADLIEPHVYHWWIKLFGKALVIDELPEQAETLVDNLYFRHFLLRMLALQNSDPTSAKSPRWCDNTLTLTHETCSELLTSTFKEAVLAAKSTPWGAAHSVQLTHTFSSIGIIGSFFHRSIEVGGTDFSPHCTMPNFNTDFFTNWGPNLRFVSDLSDEELVYWAISTGQSGVSLSSHYDDMSKIFHYGPLMVTSLDEKPKGRRMRLTSKPESYKPKQIEF